MSLPLSARGVLAAGAALAALAGASPASAAVQSFTVDSPAKVGEVRYVGPHTTLRGVAQSDQPVEHLLYWVETTTGTDVVGSETERYLASPDSSGETGRYQIGFPTEALVHGTEYVVQIRVTEQGSSSEYTFTEDFEYDGEGPAVDITAPGATTTDTTPLFSGTGETGARVYPSLHGTVYRGTDTTNYENVVGGFATEVGSGNTWSTDELTKHEYDENHNWVARPVTLAKGTYTAVASQCDDVGNCTNASRTFEVVDPAPTQTPTGTPTQTATQTPAKPAGGGTPPAGGSQPGANTLEVLREIQQEMLENATGRIGTKLGGVLKTIPVQGSAPAGGTLATCVFLNAANAAECLGGRAATASAAAKKKGKKKAKKKVAKNLLARGAHTFAAAGTATIKVKPTKGAKKRLKGRKKAKIVVMTVFRPAAGGSPIASTEKVTLKK